MIYVFASTKPTRSHLCETGDVERVAATGGTHHTVLSAVAHSLKGLQGEGRHLLSSTRIVAALAALFVTQHTCCAVFVAPS